MPSAAAATAVAKKSRKRTAKKNVTLKFRCAACGTCCRLWVPVTASDVRRLAAGTDLGADKIVQFVGVSLFEGDQEDRDDLASVKLGVNGTRKVMCLRESAGGCRFLTPRSCLAYEHRPLVCREFPFDTELDDEDEKIKKIDMNDACDCARTTDGEITKKLLLDIAQRISREDEEYEAEVDRWNRRPKSGTTKEFLKYLGLL